MYTPPAFAEHDAEAIAAIIRAARLPILVSTGPGGIEASHLPLLYHAEPAPHGRLIGHLARANPQWRALRDGAPAMAIFQAHDFYVSPNWYETKRETGKVVPTWNYEAVHAYGPVEIVEDAAGLHEIVAALTERHEATQPAPWRVEDAPADYRAAQYKGIVGVVMTIERIVAKRKLSQNRPPADRQGVIAGLEAAGDHASAAAMRAADK